MLYTALLGIVWRGHFFSCVCVEAKSSACMCAVPSSSLLHCTNWTSGILFVSMPEDSSSSDGVCIAWPKNIYIIDLAYPGTGHGEIYVLDRLTLIMLETASYGVQTV